MTVIISVDAMGGDFGPKVILKALAKVLVEHPDVYAIVYGDSSAVTVEIDRLFCPLLKARLTFQHTSSQVSCDDKPSSAIRSKQDSSMALALKAVQAGEAHACISAGNTGVLMALSLFILGTLPNISRPAICAPIPTHRGDKLMLDLGANVDCSPQQLYQFALLGSHTASATLGIRKPSVRLLNVGSEPGKGNKLVQTTAELLASDTSINYAGFIEGDEVFKGEADIIVCDGFAGNIALKVGEGVAAHINEKFSSTFSSNGWYRFLAFILKSPLSNLKKSIQPSLFNGAYLLGINGVVVKSHGSADVEAFSTALTRAINAARYQLPSVLSPLLKQTNN